jgi:hypothetical protein
VLELQVGVYTSLHVYLWVYWVMHLAVALLNVFFCSIDIKLKYQKRIYISPLIVRL